MKCFIKVSAIIVLLSFSGVFFCAAGSSNDTFFKANKLYDDGKFENAAELYERLISQGVVSGNIYYNLGNAYYKMDKRGKALLNYERAKKFIPGNEDLFANMSFIVSALDVEQPKETYSLYQKIWRGISGAISINAWFIFTVILFFSVCLVLGAGFINYRFRPRARMISGLLIIIFSLSFICFLDAYNVNKHFREGVIVASEADVRYSPSYSGVIAFKLVEGMKAQIIRKQDSWTHIRLNKEKSGWVESEAIESIW